jgi:hypothetical protein
MVETGKITNIDRGQKCAVLLLTVVGAAFFVVMGFFTTRQWGGEERTLYNIPYTYLREGRLAFPAYGYKSFDRLFVHPPTHYLEIAYLMKLGLPLYYAEAVPTAVWAICCLVLIATARFSPEVKLGLLAGLIAAGGWVATLGASDFSFDLRPDSHLAFALLAGFLAFTAAQAQGWDYKRLFIGAFLVVYGSTVHYPAWGAWTGIAGFLSLAYRELPWRAFFKRLLLISLAGSIAGIPYLLGNIIPNFGYIKQFSFQVSLPRMLDTIRQNFPLYRGVATETDYALFRFPHLFYAWPLKEGFALAIPPFLVAVAFLIWHRQTRALAVACLPFSVFLFAILARKLFSYLYLESILAIMGPWLLISCLWTRATARIPVPYRRASPPIFAVAILLTFWFATPELTRAQLKYQRHEFGFIRARAKEVMGPNAIVGGIHPLWYFGGGSRFLDVSGDLLVNLTPDLPTYLSRFDAIGVFNMASYGTSTGITEASLYVSGLLHLRGFMESRLQPASRWVWFSPRTDQPVMGFVWKNETLLRFRQASDGQALLTALVVSGDVDPFVHALAPLQYWALDLPKVAGDLRPRYVLVMLLEKERYIHGSAMLSKGKPLDVIYGNLESLNAESLPYADDLDPVAISRTYPELLAAIATPAPGGLRKALTLRPEGQTKYGWVPGRSDWNSLELASTVMDRLAEADLPELESGKFYRLRFEADSEAGGLSTLLLRQSTIPTVDQAFYREVPLRHSGENFVFQYSGSARLQLVLAANNVFRKGPVRLKISDPILEQVILPR